MMTNFFVRRRKELGLSQFKVAVAMGVTPSAVSAWENEQSVPRLSLAERLAKVYDVSETVVTAEIVKLSKAVAAAS